MVFFESLSLGFRLFSESIEISGKVWKNLAASASIGWLLSKSVVSQLLQGLLVFLLLLVLELNVALASFPEARNGEQVAEDGAAEDDFAVNPRILQGAEIVAKSSQ